MCGRTAVPVRRAVFSSSSMSAGEWHSASFFSFAPSCLLPALSCPYHPVVSYRLRPVEALRGGRRGVGRYASAGRWCDLAARPSVPSPRLALRPVRFSRIGLRAGYVRRFCQLILLRHSLAVGGRADRFLFRLVSRLACSSRGGVSCYSLRLASRPVLLINSIRQRLARRLARRLALRSVSFVSCYPSRSGVSLSSPCSLFSLGGSSRRLVWRGVSSVIRLSFRSLSVLVSSHSLRLMAMATAARLVPCLVAALRWRNGRVVRRYGRRTVFVSSISSHQGEGNDDIDKAAGEENAMRRLGYMGR